MLQHFRYQTLAIFFLFPAIALAGQSDAKLDIYWADTEGGTATLIVTPAGESLLIDSGNPGRRDSTRIFEMATKAAGLHQIDHLVTTHYHIDHFGGAAPLAELMPIKHVYDNGQFEGGRERPDKDYLGFKTDARTVLNPGDEIKLKEFADGPRDATRKPTPLTVRCLAARQKFIEPTADAPATIDGCSSPVQKERDESDNANSIVLLTTFGKFKFYAAGDLTWNMEQKLVCPVNLVGPVDVYQVTHHGLDFSNNPLVVNTLTPTVAIMSNGPTKGCEPNTLATLKAQASIKALFQIHRNTKADDEHNTTAARIANPDEKCQGNFIHLSVEPEGKSYSVEIPATKHVEKFTTK